MHVHIRDKTWQGLCSYVYVFCDGVQLKCCIEACEDGGWARVALTYPQAPDSKVLRHVCSVSGTRLYMIVSGDVRLRVRENVPERYVPLWRHKRQEVHRCEGPAHEWPDGYHVASGPNEVSVAC